MAELTRGQREAATAAAEAGTPAAVARASQWRFKHARCKIRALGAAADFPQGNHFRRMVY